MFCCLHNVYTFGSFFSDPSAAALGCAKTGPVQVADNIVIGKEGEVRRDPTLYQLSGHCGLHLAWFLRMSMKRTLCLKHMLDVFPPLFAGGFQRKQVFALQVLAGPTSL